MWARGWGVGGVGGWGVGYPLGGKIRQVVFDGFPYTKYFALKLGHSLLPLSIRHFLNKIRPQF